MPLRSIEPKQAQGRSIAVEWADEVPSTQQVARERILKGLDDARAFAARMQTGGYGRQGRVWQSPVGGLWMTLALPDIGFSELVSFGVRIGIAAGQVIEHTLDPAGSRPAVRIKWPNDVLIDGRKVAGILCESFTHLARPWLLIGIGMNVNNRPDTLPGPLRRPAASLIEFLGAPPDLTSLGQLIADHTAASLGSPLGRASVEWASMRLWRLDQPVVIRTAGEPPVHGILRGLTDGCLLVAEIGGRRTVLPPSCEIDDP